MDENVLSKHAREVAWDVKSEIDPCPLWLGQETSYVFSLVFIMFPCLQLTVNQGGMSFQN